MTSSTGSHASPGARTGRDKVPVMLPTGRTARAGALMFAALGASLVWSSMHELLSHGVHVRWTSLSASLGVALPIWAVVDLLRLARAHRWRWDHTESLWLWAVLGGSIPGALCWLVFGRPSYAAADRSSR